MLTRLVHTIPSPGSRGGWCRWWSGASGLVASSAHPRGVNDAIGRGRGVLPAVVAISWWVRVVMLGVWCFPLGGGLGWW